MSIVWHKVFRDLWRDKFRTFLIVLSTAVGVFALGFVYGTSDVMEDRMTENHEASVFPYITFFTSLFDREAIDAMLHQESIISAEGQRVASFRWRLQSETDWRDGIVYARDDYGAQCIDLFELLHGRWPTGRELAVERLASQHLGIPLGTDVIVEFGRSERRLPVVGLARQSQVLPPQWGGHATFYATMETLAWLTDQERGFNRLHLRLVSFNEEGAEETAEQMENRLERMDIDVGLTQIYDPDVHWLQETIDSILIILKVLGALSLGLSGFLIINMMNATVAQQIWQIGLMRVVGATRGQVIKIYLGMASFYGTSSLLLAVLPGALASHLLAGWLLNLMNVIGGRFRLTPLALGIQVAVGLLVPLVAAVVPVIGGARATPHQAISSYRLGSGFGRSRLDRLIAAVRGLPRALALSLRNTLRRKARITCAKGCVRVISTDDLGAADLRDVDLMVMGIPTHRMNLPEEIRPVVKGLPKPVLSGAWVAAFDTSYKMSTMLAGSTAARKLARKLRKLGGTRIVPPETFHVVGRRGPLYDGELDRAEAWAAAMVEQLESSGDE